MRKTLIIARREYAAAVRTRSFLVTLFVMPLMMTGSILVQALLKDYQDITDRRIAIVDRTPAQTLAPILQAASQRRNQAEILDPKTSRQFAPRFLLEIAPPAPDPARQRFDLSQRVRQGQLFAFVEIGDDVLQPPTTLPATRPASAPADSTAEDPPDSRLIQYHSASPTYTAFTQWFDPAVNQAIQSIRLNSAGLPEPQIRSLLRSVYVQNKGLSTLDPATGQIIDASPENRLVSMILPIACATLLFMMILIGASPLLQGVLEEKTLRIAEVLLGSVRPFELMMGKLLGSVGVALTLACVYLAGAAFAARHLGLAQHLSPLLILGFIAFLILAVMMFGSIFIAVGAACTDIKETQSLLLPVMLVIAFPMFFLSPILQNPDGTLAQALSFFPPSVPTVLILRMAIPPGPPLWQIATGVIITLATTLLLVWAAGRIFRAGFILQGKRAGLAEMARWVLRG